MGACRPQSVRRRRGGNRTHKIIRLWGVHLLEVLWPDSCCWPISWVFFCCPLRVVCGPLPRIPEEDAGGQHRNKCVDAITNKSNPWFYACEVCFVLQRGPRIVSTLDRTIWVRGWVYPLARSGTTPTTKQTKQLRLAQSDVSDNEATVATRPRHSS